MILFHFLLQKFQNLLEVRLKMYVKKMKHKACICGHLKYDHKIVRKDKKEFSRSFCEWFVCDCLKFQEKKKEG